MMAAHSKRPGELPTAPAHAARLAIYEPTQKPGRRVGEWMQTSWGRARVEGRLGQRHADAIEACQHCAQQSYIEPDGRMRLLVDPYRVRQAIGQHYSHQRLWVLLRDVMGAVVEWESTAGHRGLGHIIDDVVESPVTARDPLSGRSRALWRVTLGAAWVQLVGADIALRYDPAPVAALAHGISQAAARLMLGQPGGTRYSVETVLDHLGVGQGQGRRNARRRLAADAGGMEAAGVVVERGFLVRACHSGPMACHSGPIACHSGPIACHSGPIL